MNDEYGEFYELNVMSLPLLSNVLSPSVNMKVRHTLTHSPSSMSQALQFVCKINTFQKMSHPVPFLSLFLIVTRGGLPREIPPWPSDSFYSSICDSITDNSSLKKKNR